MASSETENPDREDIERSDTGEITVLRLPKSELFYHGKLLKELLTNLIGEGRYQIVLDMSEVSMVSSVFFGALIATTQALKPKNGCIKLATLQPNVASAFAVTRLSRIFEIFDDTESAVQSFG